MLNDLSYGAKSGQIFFRFFTMNAFDRRTDRILIARPRLHCMQRGKNLKFGVLRFLVFL